MASMDITNQESAFLTPACKKRKASNSLSLPPSTQPSSRPPATKTGFDDSLLTIIYEINDPSAKYVSLEKKLIIRRFRLSPSSGMVVRNGKDILKIAEIR